MAWIRKTALKALLRDLEASYSEHQHWFTWYGRALFRGDDAEMYCDYTLGDADGIRNEDLIVGTRYTGAANPSSETARRARDLVEKKFANQLLACQAAMNRSPQLDGKKAESHAFRIVEVTPTWSVAEVKLPRRRRIFEDDYDTSAKYLVTNGLITSLPRL